MWVIFLWSSEQVQADLTILSGLLNFPETAKKASIYQERVQPNKCFWTSEQSYNVSFW